jgi:hypothetical protein
MSETVKPSRSGLCLILCYHRELAGNRRPLTVNSSFASERSTCGRWRSYQQTLGSHDFESSNKKPRDRAWLAVNLAEGLPGTFSTTVLRYVPEHDKGKAPPELKTRVQVLTDPESVVKDLEK